MCSVCECARACMCSVCECARAHYVFSVYCNERTNMRLGAHAYRCDVRSQHRLRYLSSKRGGGEGGVGEGDGGWGGRGGDWRGGGEGGGG